MNKYTIERIVFLARSINWDVVTASSEERDKLEAALQAVEATDYSPNHVDLLERLADVLDDMSQHACPSNKWLGDLSARLTVPLHGATRCWHCHEWVG